MTTPQKLPSGRYRVRYTDVDGRRRSRTFLTLREARRFDAEVRTEVANGRWRRPEPAGQSFDVWAEKWFRHNHPAKRRTTRSWDLSLYRTHVKPRWGDVPLGEITREDVRGWVADLSDPSKYQTLRFDAATGTLVADGGPLAARTVAQVYAVFAKVLRGAVADRLIESPLPTRVSLPRAQRKHERFLDDDEIAVLAKAFPEAYRPLILVCCYGGLRIGEAAALQVGDVDWARKQVRVHRTQTDVGGVIAYDEPKTAAGIRRVPLPDQVLDVLRDHIDRWVGSNPVGHVFFSPTGKDLRAHTWRRRVFYPAVEASGLERLTPHDMRHTAAAILISTGANQWELAEILGHKDTRMIDRVYGHLFHDDRARLQQRLTDRYEGPGGMEAM